MHGSMGRGERDTRCRKFEVPLWGTHQPARRQGNQPGLLQVATRIPGHFHGPVSEKLVKVLPS